MEYRVRIRIIDEKGIRRQQSFTCATGRSLAILRPVNPASGAGALEGNKVLCRLRVEVGRLLVIPAGKSHTGEVIRLNLEEKATVGSYTIELLGLTRVQELDDLKTGTDGVSIPSISIPRPPLGDVHSNRVGPQESTLSVSLMTLVGKPKKTETFKPFARESRTRTQLSRVRLKKPTSEENERRPKKRSKKRPRDGKTHSRKNRRFDEHCLFSYALISIASPILLAAMGSTVALPSFFGIVICSVIGVILGWGTAESLGEFGPLLKLKGYFRDYLRIIASVFAMATTIHFYRALWPELPVQYFWFSLLLVAIGLFHKKFRRRDHSSD